MNILENKSFVRQKPDKNIIVYDYEHSRTGCSHKCIYYRTLVIIALDKSMNKHDITITNGSLRLSVKLAIDNNKLYSFTGSLHYLMLNTSREVNGFINRISSVECIKYSICSDVLFRVKDFINDIFTYNQNNTFVTFMLCLMSKNIPKEIRRAIATYILGPWVCKICY